MATHVKARSILGMMSGTSADGVDAALCEVNDSGSPEWGRLVRFESFPYARSLREQIIAYRLAGSATFAELAQLTREITLAHIAAAAPFLSGTVKIDAIA